MTPGDISGLVLFLRADMGVTLDGSNVAAWADQSGAGHHATQANSTLQPVYDATGLNGGPLIQFDTTDDVLDNTSLALPASSPFTVFAVGISTNVNPDTADRNGTWVKLGSPTGRHAIMTSRVGGVHYCSSITADISLSSSFGIGQSPCYVTWSDDGGDGSAVMTFRANGIAKTANAGRPATLAVSGYQLNASNGAFFGAGISSLLIYNRALAPSEIVAVESYLKTAWRLG